VSSVEHHPLAPLRSLAVDDEGLLLRPAPSDQDHDAAVDVLLDGRRIWSFWTVRDTSPAGDARRLPWPKALTRFLDGRTTLTLVDHVHGHEVGRADAVLGSGEGRIEVVDKEGRPLGLDKSLVLSRLFDSRDPEQVAPLLDSIEQVLAELRSCGIEAFLAYGSLLGAVREGGLIGHDNDADLGYVSRHDHPAEAVAESFRLQRALVERGLPVTRYSGMGIRVDVAESDGGTRGLDVFGGFMRDGHLYLMGEVGAPFRRDWVWPLSEVPFEGRSFPAPAQPDRLLEAMYGPTWRTPDPAYKFTTPRSTSRRLDGWFRGTRGGRILEWDVAKPSELSRRRLRPSTFARWALETLEGPSRPETLLDVGCGAGVDALWSARRGVSTVGVDFKPTHYRHLEQRAAEEGLPLRFHWTNLNEVRSVMTGGAQLARLPGPRSVVSRHVLDAVDTDGRRGFYRLADMATRGGGRTLVQVRRGPRGAADEPVAPATAGGRGRSRAINVDALQAEVAAHGGRVLERVDVTESAQDAPQGGFPRGEETFDVTRLVVAWH
jgi:SAM-dependent methyltransferase